MKNASLRVLPVVYTPVVKKNFKKLKEKNLKKAFKKAIINIRKNPDIKETKTGDLKGRLFSLDIYYNKTNFELAYKISKLENGDIIVIIMAGTRENFYKELKRYM